MNSHLKSSERNWKSAEKQSLFLQATWAMWAITLALRRGIDPQVPWTRVESACGLVFCKPSC